MAVPCDRFEYEKRQYLIVVDYYSRWIEIEYLKSLSSTEVVKNMKRMFARWGIPDMLRSDNARCYDSDEFRLFAMNYGFKHITSSPGHSSGNGEAERGVQTVKNLMACKDDFHLALLNYRATPLKNGHSPAELMMSRKLKTKVPITPVQLQPSLVDARKLQLLEENHKVLQKQQFDRRHAAKPLVPLKEGDEVYMPDRSQYGTVVSKHTDRSYIVETPSGEYRRNRVQLNKLPPVTHVSNVPDTPAVKSHERQISPSTPSKPSPPQPSTPSTYIHIDQGQGRLQESHQFSLPVQ